MNRSLPMIPDADLLLASPSDIPDEGRGFGAFRTEKGHLPMEAMDVRGRIDGLLARVVVRQTFLNAFDAPLEASYIFPLPDRSAVTRFRMTVAGREIDGVLEERGKAREHYVQAIAEGRRASIAEEDRPGVFNLRVGNLMPGERATVELTLCGVLPYANGEATFRFPLVVAPRYIPGTPLPGPSVGEGTAVDTDAVPDASRITPPVLLPGFPNPVRLSLEVELHDGAAGAEDVRSSLHAVEDDPRDGYRRIRIQTGERLDHDFILRFHLGGDEIQSTLTLHPDADDREQGTFALTIVPPAAVVDTPARPRDVVFLLDRSGSMEGWKIVAARRAVARMIDTLNDADRFSVLTFDTTVETPSTLPDGLTPAVDRDRFRAVEFLATVNARGGTEMAEPLDRAVKLLASKRSDERDRDRILVLITDGQVGNEDQILSMLGKRLDTIRTFTIGIDRAVNEAFLRRLAERGGGSCELVESEDRLDEVMTAVQRRIGTPMLAGLSLDETGLAIEPGEIVPRRLPDLFPGSPLLILGRYRGRSQGLIAIRGTGAAGMPYVETVSATVRENPAIGSAWARGQIRQLEDRFAAGDGDRANLEKAIVGISLRYQVLCRFTAYVAVDRSQIVNPGGNVHRVTQPVELPEGWSQLGGGGARPRSRRSASMTSSGRRAGAAQSPPNVRAPMEHELSAMMAFGPDTVESAPLSFKFTASPDTAPLPPPPSPTLADRLRAGGPTAPEEAAALLADVAEELQKIHDRGLVCKALTPAIIVLDGGKPPRITGDVVAVNTELEPLKDVHAVISSYTAPEYLGRERDRFDPAGDLYTLGVILYELLTGRRPFRKPASRQERVEEILRGAPTPPPRVVTTIPGGLEAICLKAMARDPGARYASARELAEALRDFLKPRRKEFWK